MPGSRKLISTYNTASASWEFEVNCLFFIYIAPRTYAEYFNDYRVFLDTVEYAILTNSYTETFATL